MIDIDLLTIAVFDQVATATAGSAVRLLLGTQSAQSVLMGHDLPETAGELAARPVLALRRRPMPGIDRIAWLPVFTWFALGNPDAGYNPLERLARPLWEAYAGGLDLSTIGVGSVEMSVGEQGRDSSLKLLVVTYDLVFSVI